MVSSDAAANIRDRFGQCQVSREAHGKSAPNAKAGVHKEPRSGIRLPCLPNMLACLTFSYTFCIQLLFLLSMSL